jgi:ABC-type multidrug transport system fused ATPase/permease subunit
LQDVFLFHGSIYENLTLGEDIPLERIKQAAQEIEVDEFIERLPGGYDYV